MRKTVPMICIVLFVICMLIVPGMASLSNNSIEEKNVSTTITQVVIPTTVKSGAALPAQSEINTYSMKRTLDSYTIQDNSKTGRLQKNAIIDKKNLTENQKKLSTSLLMQTSASNGLQSISNKMPTGKPVYVYISVKPGYSTHIIDSFVAEVPNRDEDNHLAVAWVDVQNLNTLASVEGVGTIQEVAPPVVKIGSVTTQGDTIHKTSDVRTLYGYRGAGMKIGIISTGVDNIASSKASGDLPADVTVLSNTQGGDEGTAMLEIVHDMVPDAKLYFHDGGSNTIAFNAAINELYANGCTIICDDIGWYNEPFFEDGIVASNVATLISDNNVIYVSATGNDADVHYQGNFYSYSGTNWNDFSSGTNANYPMLNVAIPPGTYVKIFLQWNDQFGQSSNDYDLYLSDLQNPTFTIGDLGYSINNQIGGFPDPTETITYINLGSSTKYAEIAVQKYAGVSKTLELYIMGNGNDVAPWNIVASDSIFGHPAVPDVIAVAAIPASSPLTIEPSSSRGPVTITYPSAVSRSKPDISGVDCVAVTGVGGFGSPFCGTSASAPHIAAIVAQIWGAHPSLTPAQVQNALYTTGVDLGITGKDITFGYGRADALAMANLLASSTAPVAAFSGMPTIGNAPLTVHFSDNSTGSPAGWAWYFGDENWTTPSWTIVNASPAFTERAGHAMTLLANGSLLIAGGYNAGLFMNDVWVSNDAGNTWTQVNSSAGWAPRYSHSLVTLTDGSEVLFGGTTAVGDQNDVWRSTDNGTTWHQQTAGAQWTAREWQNGVALPDGSIVVMGGTTVSASKNNNVWRSTDKGVTWSQQTGSASWTPRYHMSSTVLPDGSIFLGGGYDDGVYFNDTYLSTDKGVTWTQRTSNAGWAKRFGAATVAMPDGSLITMGGNTGSFKNDTWRSTDNGATWIQLSENSGWTARSDPAVVTMPNGSIVLSGGYLGSWINSVYKFSPTSGATAQNPSHTYTKLGIYNVALQAYNYNGYNSTRKTGYVTVTNLTTKVGVYKDGAWYLDMDGSGTWNAGDRASLFGAAGWTPVLGDWNGDNKTEIGIYKDGTWYLDYNGNGFWDAGIDKLDYFGTIGWTPVVGNWNGDATGDKIGIYKDGMWYLDNDGSGTWNAGDRANWFGTLGWIPVIGNWNGNNKTEIGIYKDGCWYLDYNGNGFWDAGIDKLDYFGTIGWTPVVGNWNGDATGDKIGIYKDGAWYLDNDGSGTWNTGDRANMFGTVGWTAIVGDWNGGGTTKIGIYKGGTWYLDYNGNGVWDAGIDKLDYFGTLGWTPVVGKWI